MNAPNWPMYGKLVGHEVVTVDFLQPGTFNGTDRIVAQTRVGRLFVSTVFLAINHQWDDGPPLWFETMAWYRGRELLQLRWTTWERAAHGHADVLRDWGSRRIRARLLFKFLCRLA